MSTSNWYNKIETSIADLTSQGLLNELNKLQGIERKVLSGLFLKKIEKNKNFRPLVFYAGYCLSKGNNLIPIENLSEKEKILISKVTTAIEIENIATYYINHYLDKKGDIIDEQDEKNRVLAGIMCRNIQQEIIEELDLENEVKLEIIKILRLIDQDIAKAQVHEVNIGIFDKLNDFKSDDEFSKIYFERCRKISGQFYGRSAEIGYIVGANSTKDSKNKRTITEFYREMATIGQFGNDIGDYAPAEKHSGTVEKNYYKDYGSDFKNKRLTYPNYLLLKRVGNDEHKKIISLILENGFTEQLMPLFIDMMKKLDVFKDCFQLLNSKFNAQKKKLDIPKSKLRTLISSSVIVMRSNKLINSIKKLP